MPKGKGYGSYGGGKMVASHKGSSGANPKKERRDMPVKKGSKKGK